MLSGLLPAAVGRAAASLWHAAGAQAAVPCHLRRPITANVPPPWTRRCGGQHVRTARPSATVAASADITDATRDSAAAAAVETTAAAALHDASTAAASTHEPTSDACQSDQALLDRIVAGIFSLSALWHEGPSVGAS